MKRKKLLLGLFMALMVVFLIIPLLLIKRAESKLEDEKCFCTSTDTVPPSHGFYDAVSLLNVTQFFPGFSKRSVNMIDEHDLKAELCLFQPTSKAARAIERDIRKNTSQKRTA